MDTETVTVVRPTGRDKFGDPLPGSPTEFDVGGCLFAPGNTKELANGSNVVEAEANIYGPAGMDVKATDKLRVRGLLYEVMGQPQFWGSTGTVVPVRRTTG